MARFPSLLLSITGAIIANCLPGTTATDTAFIAIDVPESTSPPIATNAFYVEWMYDNCQLNCDVYPEYSDVYTIIIAEPWPEQCLDLPDSDNMDIIFSTSVLGNENTISLPASELDIVSPGETATFDFLFFSQEYIITTWTETFPYIYFTDDSGIEWWDSSTELVSDSYTSLQMCSSIRLSMTSPTFAPATNMATDTTMTMTMTMTTTTTTTRTTNTAVSTDAVIPDEDIKAQDGDGGQSTSDKVGIAPIMSTVGVPSGVIVFAGAVFWAYSKWWKRE